MKHKFKNLVRGLLLLFFAQALLNSCSSEDKDEPALVGYYLALDSTEFIGITENDEANGTMAPPEDHNIFMTYLKMKKALRLSFPKALRAMTAALSPSATPVSGSRCTSPLTGTPSAPPDSSARNSGVTTSSAASNSSSTASVTSDWQTCCATGMCFPRLTHPRDL